VKGRGKGGRGGGKGDGKGGGVGGGGKKIGNLQVFLLWPCNP
jgi:hypothetical protein